MITVTLPIWLSYILIGCYTIFWVGLALMTIAFTWMAWLSNLGVYEQYKDYIKMKQEMKKFIEENK